MWRLRIIDCSGIRSTALNTNPVCSVLSPGSAGLLRSSFKELSSPFELLRSSRFLQIRLAQMLLLQLGNGWESVLDSFMISTLGACLMDGFR